MSPAPADGSELAARLLCDWSVTAGLFVKIMPRDYKRAIEAQWKASRAAAAIPVNVVSGSSRTASGIEVAQHG